VLSPLVVVLLPTRLPKSLNRGAGRLLHRLTGFANRNPKSQRRHAKVVVHALQLARNGAANAKTEEASGKWCVASSEPSPQTRARN